MGDCGWERKPVLGPFTLFHTPLQPISKSYWLYTPNLSESDYLLPSGLSLLTLPHLLCGPVH